MAHLYLNPAGLELISGTLIFESSRTRVDQWHIYIYLNPAGLELISILFIFESNRRKVDQWLIIRFVCTEMYNIKAASL